MNTENKHTPTPLEAALKLADEISRLDLDSVTKERVRMTNLIHDVIQQRESSLVAEKKRLREALGRLVRVIDAAGVDNLTRGVQLGQTSWYHKANDAMVDARAALNPST